MATADPPPFHTSPHGPDPGPLRVLNPRTLLQTLNLGLSRPPPPTHSSPRGSGGGGEQANHPLRVGQPSTAEEEEEQLQAAIQMSLAEVHASAESAAPAPGGPVTQSGGAAAGSNPFSRPPVLDGLDRAWTPSQALHSGFSGFCPPQAQGSGGSPRKGPHRSSSVPSALSAATSLPAPAPAPARAANGSSDQPPSRPLGAAVAGQPPPLASATAALPPTTTPAAAAPAAAPTESRQQQAGGGSRHQQAAAGGLAAAAGSSSGQNSYVDLLVSELGNNLHT